LTFVTLILTANTMSDSTILPKLSKKHCLRGIRVANLQHFTIFSWKKPGAFPPRFLRITRNRSDQKSTCSHTAVLESSSVSG